MRTSPSTPSLSQASFIPGPWSRLVKRAAQTALIACNIAFASVVAAQSQPEPKPAAAENAEAAPARAAHPVATPPQRADSAPQSTTTGGSSGQRPTIPFDFDADGVPDAVRREMRLEAGELLFSRFVIVSGATGLDLDAFPAPEPNDLFGWIVATVGDLDADTVPDLAVAAPRAHTGIPGDGVRGRVWILSGATHDTLLTIDGDWWGFSGLGLVVVDDQDGDGTLDLLIGGMQRIIETDPGSGNAPDGDGALFGDPPTDEPTVYFHATWSLHSLGAGEVLESGEGVPPVRFLRAGESVQALWDSGPIPGERLWLEGASGDLNADGIVDMQDLLRLIEALSDPDGAADLSHYFQTGDLNADGAVDMSDLTALLAQYGRTAQDLAHERATRANPPNPRPTGAGAAPGDCTDEFGFSGGGGCYITCVDCSFTIPIRNPPGGGCSFCPPGCPGCTHCPDCPDPPPDCTSQCECYPCSCDLNGNGTPDKDDDDDGDGILNKDDCNSQCYNGDECECEPVNLSADVNNDGVIDSEDDLIESQPHAMCVIIVNRGDVDDDGIPGYADGYGVFGPDSDSGTAAGSLIPIVLDEGGLCDFESAQISFLYNDASLDEMAVETIDVPDIESSYQQFERGSGLLRLWRKGIAEPRTAEDFIASGQILYGADLGTQRVFYVEAVNGWSTATPIIVRVTTSRGNRYIDSINFLPFDSQTGLGVPEIAGYTIVNGGGMGTPGNDIIIGSSGNDVIDAGDGDDIIVAGDGNDVIHTGGGFNTIFASKGRNEIILGSPSPPARPADGIRVDGRGSAGDKLLDEEDKPFTTQQVIKAYKLLYGENDPWLRIYLAEHGRIEAVEGDGWLWSESDWDCVSHPETTWQRPIIQLQFSIGEPFNAAMLLRHRILQIAGSFFWPCGLYNRFVVNLVGENWQAALAQNHNEYDQSQLKWTELRQQALDDVIDITTLVLQGAIEGIRLFSIGADVIVAVPSLAEGDYAELIALLPLIPSPAVSPTKIIARVGGTARLEKYEEFIRHFPNACRGSGCLVSRIGWKMKREMPIRYGPNLGGHQTVIINRGHAPQNSLSGPQHGAHSEWLADDYAMTGSVEYIVQDRSLLEATGLDGLGSVAGWKPDLVVVGRDGRISLVEIQSAGQTYNEIQTKLQQMMNAIPPELRGDIVPIPLEDYFP